jgi:hypothetical protein
MVTGGTTPELERVFMIVTAYIDEANTHGESPTVMMGSLMGFTDQWLIFSRELDRLREQYGFRVFHSKCFKARRGEFAGWDKGKCDNLLRDLLGLVQELRLVAITIHLEHERYLNEYRMTPFPSKMQPDSQYGLCFRMLLRALVGGAANQGEHSILHVVVEDGHRNVGSCRTIFAEMNNRLRRQGTDILGTLTIAKKSDSAELMAADFIAHSYYLMRSKLPANQEFDYDDPPEESVMASLRFAPGSLDFFKEEFATEKQRRMDEWRQRGTTKNGLVT